MCTVASVHLNLCRSTCTGDRMKACMFAQQTFSGSLLDVQVQLYYESIGNHEHGCMQVSSASKVQMFCLTRCHYACRFCWSPRELGLRPLAI